MGSIKSMLIGMEVDPETNNNFNNQALFSFPAMFRIDS